MEGERRLNLHKSCVLMLVACVLGNMHTQTQTVHATTEVD